MDLRQANEADTLPNPSHSADFCSQLRADFLRNHADVAKLADALDSGSSAPYTGVEVQILSSALLGNVSENSGHARNAIQVRLKNFGLEPSARPTKRVLVINASVMGFGYGEDDT
jgi:hypothetical protein